MAWQPVAPVQQVQEHGQHDHVTEAAEKKDRGS
jgi:hypothetical protein